MQYTPNLNLPKPDGTDNVTRANHNALVDAIDSGAAKATDLSTHVADKNNPHAVTYLQVGAAAANHTHADATAAADGFMAATDKSKLDGIAAGAEVNQNAFSNVLVGGITIAADTKTDTVEFAAGAQVTLTADAANDKLTIAVNAGTAGGTEANKLAVTDATGRVGDSDKVGGQTLANLDGRYTPASHVGAGGNAHAVVVAGGANGFMTGADKTKLDGVAAGAEVNQSAFSNVKVGATTIAAGSKTDTVEFAAGTGVALTPDSNTKKVTIAVSNVDAAKLGGQLPSYYLAATSYTANDVLAKIKTVDGTGSGLDADTTDGIHLQTSGGQLQYSTDGATWNNTTDPNAATKNYALLMAIIF